MLSRGVAAFVHETGYDALPPEVRRRARDCLTDLVGVAAGGLATPLSRIARSHAQRYFAPGAGRPAARLLFDGRGVSLVGGAFANAATIDALDAHDGHAGPMGHAGVAPLPALLAFVETGSPAPARELLCALAVGYEVALRAGIALRYEGAEAHGSGGWNARG